MLFDDVFSFLLLLCFCCKGFVCIFFELLDFFIRLESVVVLFGVIFVLWMRFELVWLGSNKMFVGIILGIFVLGLLVESFFVEVFVDNLLFEKVVLVGRKLFFMEFWGVNLYSCFFGECDFGGSFVLVDLFLWWLNFLMFFFEVEFFF